MSVMTDNQPILQTKGRWSAALAAVSGGPLAWLCVVLLLIIATAIDSQTTWPTTGHGIEQLYEFLMIAGLEFFGVISANNFGDDIVGILVAAISAHLIVLTIGIPLYVSAIFRSRVRTGWHYTLFGLTVFPPILTGLLLTGLAVQAFSQAYAMNAVVSAGAAAFISLGTGIVLIRMFAPQMNVVRSHIRARTIEKMRWAQDTVASQREATRIREEAEAAEREVAEKRETAMAQAMDDLADRVTARQARATSGETVSKTEDAQEREDDPKSSGMDLLLNYTLLGMVTLPISVVGLFALASGDGPGAAILLAVATVIGLYPAIRVSQIHTLNAAAGREATRIREEAEAAEREAAEKRDQAMTQAMDDLADRITARQARATSGETVSGTEDAQVREDLEREDLELLAMNSWAKKKAAEAEAREARDDAEFWLEVAEELDRRLRRANRRAAIARSSNSGDFWAGAAAASWLKS